MIENFGIANPCERCGAMKPCEATEDECYKLKSFLAYERMEDIDENTKTEA